MKNRASKHYDMKSLRFNKMINEFYYLPNVLSSTSFRCFSSLNAFNSSKLDFPLPFVCDSKHFGLKYE